jgi:Holliday junction resolvase RusA-like endonuclease
MSDAIIITVPGVPVAQPRQRHRTYQAGPRMCVANYTPATHPVQQWKAAVASAWCDQCDAAPLEGPLRLDVEFVLPRPKRLLARRWRDLLVWHAGKPDADNLLKACKDALTALAWRDDSQVCQCYCEKRYANADEQPHATISVQEVE